MLTHILPTRHSNRPEENTVLKTYRTTTVAAAGIAAAAGLLALAAAPASAASSHGCAASSVCFYLKTTDYNNNHPTASYKDVTSSFQTLGSRGRGAKAIVNTRSSRVQIRFLDGGHSNTTCLNPRQVWAPVQSGFTVTAVKIESAAKCPIGP